jgi:hypothetical protein
MHLMYNHMQNNYFLHFQIIVAIDFLGYVWPFVLFL